ncbi:hypothetical protein [Streptomyces mayteni]
MNTPVLIAATLLALTAVCGTGYLRGRLARHLTADVCPTTPHAGFATPEQLHAHLSEAAVRRAGGQVRPGLVLPSQRTAE